MFTLWKEGDLTPIYHAPNIFTVPDFLSSKECDDEIAYAEEIGFSDAPVTTAAGMLMMKEIRNNERVMDDDPERAAELWQRLTPLFPEPFKNIWQPIGLNERLRYYRYDVGQQFN